MPATVQIADNGASIKITTGTQVRNISKAQIVEVAVIKTSTIKIDIGQGNLNNIFFDFASVTSPVTANAGALRDVINDMMAPAATGSTGNATEAKQDTEITKLDDVKTLINNLKTLLISLDDKHFYEPLVTDESNPSIVYKGYAVIGTSVDVHQWAISKTVNVANIITTTWADGNRNMDNDWLNRETLAYS
jgi:hypothetical protein